MRLLELLCENIINSELFENAFKRQEVESRITDLSHPIIEHLIKILKWKDDRNYQKHIHDINGCMYKIQSFKLKRNTKPSQQDYYQWMVVDVLQDELNVELWIRGLHRYNHLSALQSDEEVFNIIKSILYKVSFDLLLIKFRNIEDYMK